jgi:hypothetical protein
VIEWQPSGAGSGKDDLSIRNALWHPVTVTREGVIILTDSALSRL